MKIRHQILIMLALAVSIGCAGNRAHRSDTTTAGGRPAAAVDLLRHRDPQASWEAASLIHADLDRDGIADYALRGLRKDRVVVGIVKGPLEPQSRTWILDFAWGKGTQDSLCSPKAKIELEDLDDSTTAGAKPAGGKPSRGRAKAKGQGISLYDDRCDAFHIYWSPEDQKFDWWRL